MAQQPLANPLKFMPFDNSVWVKLHNHAGATGQSALTKKQTKQNKNKKMTKAEWPIKKANYKEPQWKIRERLK